MNHPYNTIVVVDDNKAILTALKICLAMDFERIVTLSSPDTLVATLAKEEAVDAVLLDMNFSLGVNSGRTLLATYRKETLSQYASHPDNCLCRCATGGERAEIRCCRFRNQALG